MGACCTSRSCKGGLGAYCASSSCKGGLKNWEPVVLVEVARKGWGGGVLTVLAVVAREG